MPDLTTVQSHAADPSTGVLIALAPFIGIIAAFLQVKERNSFFVALTREFKLGTLETVADVKRIFGSTVSSSKNVVEQQSRLLRWLGQYITLHLVKIENDDSFVVETKRRVDNFISGLQNEMPFSDIPSPEGGILREILVLNQDGNGEAIKVGVSKLGDSMRIRFADLKRIKLLSRISFWFGLLFGIANFAARFVKW